MLKLDQHPTKAKEPCKVHGSFMLILTFGDMEIILDQQPILREI